MSLFVACALFVPNQAVADAFGARQADDERWRVRRGRPSLARRRRTTIADLVGAPGNTPPSSSATFPRERGTPPLLRASRRASTTPTPQCDFRTPAKVSHRRGRMHRSKREVGPRRNVMSTTAPREPTGSPTTVAPDPSARTRGSRSPRAQGSAGAGRACSGARPTRSCTRSWPSRTTSGSRWPTRTEKQKPHGERRRASLHSDAVDGVGVGGAPSQGAANR